MKKALIVLLILAVAGGLFAQSFSGRVGTGAVFAFDGEDNPVWAYEGTDYRHKAVWAEVNFANSGDDWGIDVKTSAEVDDKATGKSGLNIEDFNGWVKFADMFKLTAGKGVVDAWHSNYVWWDRYDGGAASFRLEATPIDGLDLGFLFNFPNDGSSAGKIANFFEETVIGASYDAGILAAWTTFQLESPETDGYTDMDATWKFGVKVPLTIVNVGFQGKIGNLMSDKTIKVGEQIDGSIVGLDWYLNSQQDLTSDAKVDLEVGLSYGIPINDKASAKVGASAKTDIIPDFDTDNLKWNAYGKVDYSFNGNVSTAFELGLDNGKRDDGFDFGTGNVTPYLFWKVGYSF